MVSGITLSNELRADWFSRLGVASTSIHEAGDQLSVFGSLTTAMLGFARTKASAIGFVASLFGFGKQTADSLEANYIVSTDIGATESSVQRYRAGYAQEIEQSDGRWVYATARGVIMAYDNTCSSLQVKRFITNKIDRINGSEVVQNLYGIAVGKFVDDVNKGLPQGEAPYNETDLTGLFAYLYMPGLDADLKAKITSALPSKIFVTDQTSGAKIIAPNEYFGYKSASELKQHLVQANIYDYVKKLAADYVNQATADAHALALIDARNAAVTAARLAVTDADTKAAAAQQAFGSAKIDAEKAEVGLADATARQKTAGDAFEAASTASKAPPPADPLAVAAIAAKLEQATKERNDADTVAIAAAKLKSDATAILADAKAKLDTALDAKTTAANALKSAQDGLTIGRRDAEQITQGSQQVADDNVNVTEIRMPVASDGRPLDEPPTPQ